MNGNSSHEEFHILAGDQGSHEPMEQDLLQVQDNSKIVKLEMEDYVGNLHRSEYHSLLPLVQKVLTCDERDWRRIRFADTLEAKDFSGWQKFKFDLMRGYEDNLPDHLLEFLTVEADIVVHSHDEVMPLLECLPDDEDIVSLQFGGALQGLEAGAIPEALDKSLRQNAGISIHLVCGWQDEEEEENTEWRELCAECKAVLEESGNEPINVNPRLPPVRSNTAPDTLDDDSNIDASDGASPRTSDCNAVPRMPARGVRRGTLTRETPERAKSMGVLPARSASAVDRLALLGASGSRRVGSRRVPERTTSRSIPDRTASGRLPPTRTTSRKVSDGNERSLPQRTNSRRGPPARSTSRKVSRPEDIE